MLRIGDKIAYENEEWVIKSFGHTSNDIIYLAKTLNGQVQKCCFMSETEFAPLYNVMKEEE